MQDAITRRAAYADLEAVPEHLVAQILNGVLVTHPGPAGPHAVATNAISGVLTPPFQFGIGGLGRWIFMDEPELHFDADVAVADKAGWLVERMPELPSTAYTELPPDWVCEVLARRTEKYDRGEKRDVYARAGIKHLWLVDPRLKLLEVFKLSRGRWVLVDTHRGEGPARAAPFEAIAFPLKYLWPLKRRRAAAQKKK